MACVAFGSGSATLPGTRRATPRSSRSWRSIWPAGWTSCAAPARPKSDATSQLIAELQGSTELARAIRRADRQRPAAPVPPALSARRLLTDVSKDVRYAARLLRRTPGFTSAALLTLALGIGMTTAIFSVVQAVLLRPVPFPEPERLVLMWETDRNSGTTREPASIPDFVDYRQMQPAGGPRRRLRLLRREPGAGRRRAAAAVGARRDARACAAVRRDHRRGTRVHRRRRSARGPRRRADQRPSVGTALRARSPPQSARRFGSTASSGPSSAWCRRPRTSACCRFCRRPTTRAASPIATPGRASTSGCRCSRIPPRAPRGGNHAFLMVGRLAAGATVASAHDEMVRAAADLERRYPDDNAGRGAFVERLDDVVFGRTRTALTVLMAAVSLVLLISCVNVANLLLARGSSRAREVAVRTALGAELPRLARQFLVENLLLAVGAVAARRAARLRSAARADARRAGEHPAADVGQRRCWRAARGARRVAGDRPRVRPAARGPGTAAGAADRPTGRRHPRRHHRPRRPPDPLVSGRGRGGLRRAAAHRRRPVDPQLLEPQSDRSRLRRHRGAEGGIPGIARAVPGGA